jgi:hypothetical protein
MKRVTTTNPVRYVYINNPEKPKRTMRLDANGFSARELENRGPFGPANDIFNRSVELEIII